MPYSVLILDDDEDFNSLLTDIFEQADYIVTSLTNPLEAVEVFRETEYDLVVTDHKMPEMTGCEFMKVIKRVNADIPVIMVSGYLENDTIRDLISQGVGGVFLKPLNIFSLLERTSELIDEAKKLENAVDSYIEDDEEAGAQLGFVFRSFPCKSGASASFAERLYSLRNFKSTLTLLGEPGMHYAKICEDVRGFYESEAEHFIYIDGAKIDESTVLSELQQSLTGGIERVTCVLLNVEKMSAEQGAIATELAKKKGAFADFEVSLRTIFCGCGQLDNLFDEGVIDENLYILMGTAEVRVPALSECNVDVGIMAQQILAEFVRAHTLSSVPRIERSARELLGQQEWPRNYDSLREFVGRLVEADTGEVITQAAVAKVLNSGQVASARTRFEARMSSQQSDYLKAASILLDGDSHQTADFFGADLSSIEAKMR